MFSLHSTTVLSHAGARGNHQTRHVYRTGFPCAAHGGPRPPGVCLQSTRTPLRLDGLDASGAWRTLATSASTTEIAPVRFMPLAAIREMKARGVDFLLIRDSDGTRATSWRIRKRGDLHLSGTCLISGCTDWMQARRFLSRMRQRRRNNTWAATYSALMEGNRARRRSSATAKAV